MSEIEDGGITEALNKIKEAAENEAERNLKLVLDGLNCEQSFQEIRNLGISDGQMEEAVLMVIRNIELSQIQLLLQIIHIVTNKVLTEENFKLYLHSLYLVSLKLLEKATDRYNTVSWPDCITDTDQ